MIEDKNSNLAQSETFCVSFAEAVYLRDQDQNNARRRIDAANISHPFDRTPQDAVTFQVRLATAYCQVGLIDQAWECMAAMHEDTFGYWLRAKKEPQYEFWAWAYLNACDSAPDKCGEYAREFGRFILGMDETEGDETARRLIGDLLNGCGQSPTVLAALVERLIESNLTSWAEIVSTCLGAVARHNPEFSLLCIDLYGRLVVPFCGETKFQSVEMIVRALPNEGRVEAVDTLLTSVMRWAPQCQRAGLLEVVSRIDSQIEEKLAEFVTQARSVSDQLSRQSYGGSYEESNERRSNEYKASSLAELLEQGEGHSDYGDGVDYSYARASERLVEGSTRDEILVFLAARPHLKEDAKFAVACSRAMLRMGEKSLSDSLFETAEKAAIPGHWPSYFGGQKIELQDLRIERDGAEGREKGFDVLVDELASGQTYGSSLFLDLDRILGQITDDLPRVEIWHETEQHLRQYREYRLAEEVLPKETIESHEDLLAYLLAFAFDFSCPEVLDHARDAARMVAVRERGVQVIAKLILLLEAQLDGSREAAALVFRLRGVEPLREVLTKAAERLFKHDDFVVSNQAARVLREYGCKIDKESDEPNALPPFYKLVTSNSPQADDFEILPGLSPGERPVWSEDPWTWTASLEFPLKMLEEATGIELEILRRRCAEFMRREGGREAFGPEAEAHVRNLLGRMELKFPFWRLLPIAAQRGFGMTLNELVRANQVDLGVFPAIWSEIGGPSLSDFEFSTESRPEWLEFPPIPHRQHGGLDHEAWLDTTENSLFLPLPPENVVVAEKSLFRTRIQRDVIESVRIALPEALEIADFDEELHGFPRLYSVDDWRPLYGRSESLVVSTVSSYSFGDFREPTLTLCPYLVDALHWRRSPLNPLDLYDADGRMVARTLRWVDGTDQPIFVDGDAFGMGQLLLLSNRVRTKFEDVAGSLSVNAKVIHRARRETREKRERMVVAKG